MYINSDTTLSLHFCRMSISYISLFTSHGALCQKSVIGRTTWVWKIALNCDKLLQLKQNQLHLCFGHFHIAIHQHKYRFDSKNFYKKTPGTLFFISFMKESPGSDNKNMYIFYSMSLNFNSAMSKPTTGISNPFLALIEMNLLSSKFLPILSLKNKKGDGWDLWNIISQK